jgi:hypothetical protein
MNQPPSETRRDRILFRERVGDYVLTAFARPELDSLSDDSPLRDPKTTPTPGTSPRQGTW